MTRRAKRKHHTCRLRLAPRAPHQVLGGGERDRTDDPLLAKQVLSQLSYTPVVLHPSAHPLTGGSGWARTIDPRLIKTVL